MRIALLIAISMTMLTIGCAKQPGALKWQPTQEMALLPVDAGAHERAELQEALISLQRVHFAYDSTELTTESKDALVTAHSKLGANPNVQLFVEGHADERGGTEYNIGLGEERGRVVANYLTALGMAPERLTVVSYGEERPLVAERSEDAWAKNRRVDFRIMQGELQIVLEDGNTVAQR